MKRRVTMFQPAFAPLVESGAKKHTIRQKGKRITSVGDTMDAREWTGKPYRSKTRKLIESPIVEVNEIKITAIHRVWIDRKLQTIDQVFSLANSDGFHGTDAAAQFIQFFRSNYGLPFDGQIIHWK